jgi:oligopeptide transport system permease protein
MSGTSFPNVAGAVSVPLEAGESRRWRQRYLLAWIGGAIVLAWLLVALLGPLLAPYPSNAVELTQRLQPPSLDHLLGTDQLGRDLLSRTLVGGQVSLLVGLVATVVSLAIGVLYGAVSGYAGGRTDRWMMGGVDVMYAVPFMFLVILLLTFFHRSLLMLFIALGAVQWLTMARIVRGQVMSLVNAEFISAARLSGASHWRIITRHLIPNSLGPVIVYTTLTVPAVILQESFLAFLGLGVGFAGRQVDSWGALVSAGAQATHQPWLLIVPATLMSVTLLALNVLGDGLRDALDPRLEAK